MTVIGSLKEGAAPLPHDEAERVRIARAFAGRPVWLAASTHPGEEEVVLAAHVRARRALPMLALILAPRHPARGDALAEMLRARGFQVAQRSGKARPIAADTDVYLADTLGEMGLWYRIASVSFVGGSLVAVGGHNPFEPALLGSAILHGPHVRNFLDPYRRLQRGRRGGRGARRGGAGRGAGRDHGARPRRRHGRRRLGRLQRGRRGHRRRARRDRRLSRPAALMRAPRLLGEPAGAAGAARAPAGARSAWAWAAVTRRRLARGPGARAGVPVICVGNLTAGGAGKTPDRHRAGRAAARRAAARCTCSRAATAAASRGRSGSIPARHAAAEVGDEPLLLAAFAPVWVGARPRRLGARGGRRRGRGAAARRRLPEPRPRQGPLASWWSTRASASATAG